MQGRSRVRTRRWRKWWVAGSLLLLLAQGAIAASSLQDFEERVLQAIARHADREAANLLIEAWQQRSQGGASPGGVALNEGLNGHYLTAKQLMARVVSETPSDPSARLGSLVLVLLEGNPPTCRQALEDLAAVYPENPQLQQRYSDVLEAMGLAPAALPTPPEPDEAAPAEPASPATEPSPPPSEPVAVATPTPPRTDPKEIRPVQTESVREQLLRQLAESQARQAKEEAARQQRLKDEQARKRREEAARLSAEKKRREEAARLAAERQRQQEQARLAAEREKAEQARLAAEQKAAQRKQTEQRKAEQLKAADQRKAAEQAKLAEQRKRLDEQEKARQAEEQRRRLERAEQERWLAARRQQPSAPPSGPVVPTPPPVESSAYVLKPIKIANRRVWVGEARTSVHTRLGRPSSTEGPGFERYAGLSIWYDSRGKVSTFELGSAWYYGPGGVRPGLTLREVLKALPNSDGLFHLQPTGPEATSSLYVLSTVDGTIAELQFNDEAWLSTMVRTTTPAGATHLYEELLKKGPVRRLAPDYVFALEARRRPLP